MLADGVHTYPVWQHFKYLLHKFYKTLLFSTEPMYTKSIILEEITKGEYQQRAAELEVEVPSSGLYAKITNPLTQELNGTETTATYCQLFAFLLEHPCCRQIRVWHKDRFITKKKKNIRSREDLEYIASVAATNAQSKDLFKLQFRIQEGEPRSMLSFRRLGNKLMSYAAEVQYCHRELFDVRIDKEYTVVNGLWVPG